MRAETPNQSLGEYPRIITTLSGVLVEKNNGSTIGHWVELFKYVFLLEYHNLALVFETFSDIQL